jgi:hypothetical protein
MANEKLCLKDYIKCVDNNSLSKTHKKMNKKSHKGRYYGGGMGIDQGSISSPSDGGGIGESFLIELLGAALPTVFSSNVNMSTALTHGEEEAETTMGGGSGGGGGGNKIDKARQLFQALINRPDANRQGIIDQFIQQVGVTHSTAVSYYERLAKEAGLTNQNDKEDLGASFDSHRQDSSTSQGSGELEQQPTQDEEFNDENADDPYRAGILRTVPGAHLIYKRRTEEGTYEELWIYNVGDKTKDELDVRRDILAGTDIPPKKTKSPDGTQVYTLTTMGNAQYLDIKGLPN